jgi:beta-galactosidase
VRWDTLGHLLRYYQALKSLGAPVDVITEEKDFARYPFLVAPAYQLVDEKLIGRLTAYVRAGGHLVLSCRSAQKDRRGQLFEAAWAGPINELIGAKIPFFDVLPAPVTGKVRVKDKEYAWVSWGEILEPAPGVTALAHYADHFYAGKAAAVTRKLGAGTVTYIGVDSVDGALERDLVKGVFQAAGVRVENFDPQFLVDWRDGFWVATNFTEKRQAAPLRPGAKLLIGEKEPGPAGVAVWVE